VFPSTTSSLSCGIEKSPFLYTLVLLLLTRRTGNYKSLQCSQVTYPAYQTVLKSPTTGDTTPAATTEACPTPLGILNLSFYSPTGSQDWLVSSIPNLVSGAEVGDYSSSMVQYPPLADVCFCQLNGLFFPDPRPSFHVAHHGVLAYKFSLPNSSGSGMSITRNKQETGVLIRKHHLHSQAGFESPSFLLQARKKPTSHTIITPHHSPSDFNRVICNATTSHDTYLAPNPSSTFTATSHH